MSEGIDWGDCLCAMPRCVAVAECEYDDIPLCIDCADMLIDRQVAIFMDGRMRELLPELSDR